MLKFLQWSKIFEFRISVYHLGRELFKLICLKYVIFLVAWVFWKGKNVTSRLNISIGHLSPTIHVIVLRSCGLASKICLFSDPVTKHLDIFRIHSVSRSLGLILFLIIILPFLKHYMLPALFT